MKIWLLTLVVLLSLGNPALAEELKRISLDDALAIGLQIQSDSAVKAEGKASIKITTKWPTTICLAEVPGPDIENAMLVYKAKVKSDLQAKGRPFWKCGPMWGEGSIFPGG